MSKYQWIFTRLNSVKIKLPILMLTATMSSYVNAQLVECDQVNYSSNVGAFNGCIERSLQDQIDIGQGDENQFGSSIYLIKRDPARSIRRGRQLFQRKFTRLEGLGPRVNIDSSGDIVKTRALGAGFADSCAACHGRPRGSAGFGGDVNTRPDSRDAPHLFGLGIVEQLADEMTNELRSIRKQVIDDAQNGSTGQVILLDADFDTSDGFFEYRDDVLNTSEPRYAMGFFSQLSSDDTRAVVMLGGIDNVDVFGMSGGWETSFDLPFAATVQIDLNFRVRQQPDYEPDEFTQAIVDIDGQQTILATVTGDGNGGPVIDTNIQTKSIEMELQAGSHTLTLIGYNNKKTRSNESSAVSFDNIVVKTLGGQPDKATAKLVAKGIDFGSITAHKDGTVDTSAIVGVDADLRIRPFFHHGGTVSMREFIVGAFNDEMGLQVVDPILCAVTDPDSPRAMTSPSGFVYDPTMDMFERPKTCHVSDDVDDDKVTNEIDAALLDHLEFYLLNYFKPGQYRVTAQAKKGKQLLEDIGCTSCHVPNLTIRSDRRIADVETVYDPQNGIFNQLFATASLRIGKPVDDGDLFPQLLPAGESFVVENFYSDLKRHDLGPNFHEREFDDDLTNGTNRVTEFVTEPLWGVGSTAPYGHDGRSINLDQVIRRHGGEAQAAATAYINLSDSDQHNIREFLETLVLFPPDDTASNLNPGRPDTNDPQTPSEHGSINLGALFQIPNDMIGGE